MRYGDWFGVRRRGRRIWECGGLGRREMAPEWVIPGLVAGDYFRVPSSSMVNGFWRSLNFSRMAPMSSGMILSVLLTLFVQALRMKLRVWAMSSLENSLL